MLWYETDAVVSLCAVTKLCFDCLCFSCAMALRLTSKWLERFPLASCILVRLHTTTTLGETKRRRVYHRRQRFSNICTCAANNSAQSSLLYHRWLQLASSLLTRKSHQSHLYWQETWAKRVCSGWKGKKVPYCLLFYKGTRVTFLLRNLSDFSSKDPEWLQHQSQNRYKRELKDLSHLQ